MTETAELEYLTHAEDGRKIPQLSPREIRIVCEESLTEGFEEFVVKAMQRLAAMAAEGVEITTAVFTAVASAELEA